MSGKLSGDCTEGLVKEAHADVQDRSMCELAPLGQALQTFAGPEEKGLASPLPPSAKRPAVFTQSSGQAFPV